MSKPHRKSHRKVHRKASRKSHRKSHRKVHRKTRRQHGGSCAALPFNSQLLAQRGGMAPISNDGYLLDAATRVQAQVAPLDLAISQLATVIPKQAGGRRGYYRRGRRGGAPTRRQRGGMQDFDAAYTFNPVYTGQNPQWQSVSGAGAQAPGQINYV
jgi:hypothetical protein